VEVKRRQTPEVAALMTAAIDRLIKESFAAEDTDETLSHYSNQRLSEVAPKIIGLYEENAVLLTHLGDFFASRVGGVPGHPAIEIAPLFAEVEAAAERVMKSVWIVPTLGEYHAGGLVTP
jgi:hypothetical protein